MLAEGLTAALRGARRSGNRPLAQAIREILAETRAAAEAGR